MALGCLWDHLLATGLHNVYSTPTQHQTQHRYSRLTQHPVGFENLAEVPQHPSRGQLLGRTNTPRPPLAVVGWGRCECAAVPPLTLGWPRWLAAGCAYWTDGNCIGLCAYPLACSGCAGMPLQASPAQTLGQTSVSWSCQALASGAPLWLA